MIVASISTASARPTPICLNSSIRRVAKIPNTATMTIAALVTTEAVLRDAVGDGLLGAHAAIVTLADAAEDEHVVVHRQPEQDHEQEQRQPRRDASDRGEAEHRLQVAVLEDPDQHAVRRADGQQVEHDRGERDHERAERQQQQQEGEREHECEDPRRARLHERVEVIRHRRGSGHVGPHAGLALASVAGSTSSRRAASARSDVASVPLPATAMVMTATVRSSLMREAERRA